MANQMIALQARGPQLPDPSKLTAQYANMLNMTAQRRTAERQGMQAQQQMDINAAEEARAAALHTPALAEAGAKASAAELKTALEFNAFVYTALSDSDSPQQVAAVASRIASLPQFQSQMYQGTLSDAVAAMPQDPEQFMAWKENTKAKTLTAAQQMEQEYIKQTTGTEERLIGVSKYRRGAATEVPGSRIQVAEGMNYIKGADGATYAVPTKSGGSFGTPAPAAAPGKGSPVANALKTNPGAIKDGGYARSQPGYTGSSGGFATFDSPASGIAAQENLLRGAYVNKGFNTIDKIVNKYAPQGKENSGESVKNYKNYVARRAGVDINTPISAAQIPAVAKAMREFETNNKVGVGTGTSNAAPGGLTPILPGKPPAPAKGDISPEKRKARDLAVQDLYDAVVDAQKKGHLVSDTQSYVANRAAELRRDRPYVPGGTAQKTSLDNIEANAAQLLRQIIQEGTSGTLNAVAEQKLFLKGVGGADSTYETRLRTIRNFAKQNGITLNEAGTAKPKATAPKRATPTKSSIPDDIAKMYGL
jgi:hypothetical protein